jgi:hypothetical protein
MCLACEQDAMWLAYLESQGLLKPDGPAAVDAFFGAFPVQPLPMQQEQDVQGLQDSNEPAKVPEKNPFSCDDPTAGAADLKFLQPGRKPE